MNTMHKVMLTVLGVLLGTLLLATPASANHSADFTYDTLVHYGSGTTNVQDASYNPDGDELTIEWDCFWDGSPEGFEPEQAGSTASCYYERSMMDPDFNYSTFLGQRVTAHGVARYDGKTVEVREAAEAPGGLSMVTPSNGSLPRTVTFSTNKPNSEVRCRAANIDQDQCAAEYVGTKGPDGNGRYLHSYEVPVAPVGQVDLTFSSWLEDDNNPETETFQINVTGNAIDPFGRLERSWETFPISEKKCEVRRFLSYYSTENSTWKLKFKAKWKKKVGKRAKKLPAKKRWKKKSAVSKNTEEGDYLPKSRAYGSIQIPTKKLARKYKLRLKVKESIVLPSGRVHSAVEKRRVEAVDCAATSPS